MSNHELAYVTIVGAYLVAMTGIAAWLAKRWIGDEHDFMIAGREIGATLHAASMVAILLSGGFVPAIVLQGYVLGVGGVWFFWGWAVGHLLVLLTWAGFWRYTGGYTPAEYYEYQYGESGRVAVLVAILVFGLFAGAFQYLGVGALVGGALGIPTWVAVLVVGAVITLYALLAGFWGITITDFIQAIWVVAAVFVAVPAYLFIQHGLPTVEGGVPPELLSLPFGNAQVVGLASGTVITFIVLNFFLANSAHYWMRVSSLRNERALKQGYVVAIALSVVLGIIGVLMGLWARMLVSPETPSQAFGLLISQETPIWLGALAISGVIAATMSTVDMMYQMMANTLTRDLFQRFLSVDSDEALLRYSRLTILAAGAVTITLAIVWSSGLSSLIAFAFATAGPMALLSLDAWYVRYGTKEAAVVTIVGSWIAIFLWQFVLSTPAVNVLWVSGAVSLVLFYGTSLLVRLTGPWWGDRQQPIGTIDQSAGGD
jgi:SSS family solute:Na+ symporter